MLGLSACFVGAEREKEPPPGYPGGRCREPGGDCVEGKCTKDLNVCYDTFEPCHGFWCGGRDRGVCRVNSANNPTCECFAGFDATRFALYCCPMDPQDPSDPRCVDAVPSQATGEGT